MNAMPTFLSRILLSLAVLCMMSVSALAVNFELADGTLYVEGTDGADTITISGSMDGGIEVRVEGLMGSLVLDAGEVLDVEVRGLAGDDHIYNTSDISMIAYGGEGDDILWSESSAASELYGNQGADELWSSSGSDDFMDGGRGADTLDGDDSDTCIEMHADTVTCEDSGTQWNLTKNDKL